MRLNVFELCQTQTESKVKWLFYGIAMKFRSELSCDYSRMCLQTHEMVDIANSILFLIIIGKSNALRGKIIN